jgi:hypothetical protein
LNDRRTSIWSTVLLGRCLRHRYNGYESAAFGFRNELNFSIKESEKGVVPAHAYIAAGMPCGTALATNDVSGKRDLAARFLQAKATARGVAAVTRRSACFFVRHGCPLKFRLTIYTDSVTKSSHFLSGLKKLFRLRFFEHPFSVLLSAT